MGDERRELLITECTERGKTLNLLLQQQQSQLLGFDCFSDLGEEQ